MGPVPPVALPPVVRAVLYYVIAIGGLVYTATQSVYLALGHPQPIGVVIAGIVLGALSTAFGLTAASNTAIPPTLPTPVD